MFSVDLKLLHKLSRPIPRYTSYPTAPEWGIFAAEEYENRLEFLKNKDEPLSLYFHIPFCHSMCLYCGCSVVLNRKIENEEKYVHYLIKEIELVCARIGKKNVHQLHFGGGTPTKLSLPLFSKLFQAIQRSFHIDFSKEVAIEIDPRTVFEDQGEKLSFLKSLGFNRVSFGVQDTDPKVQEAVKRRQSYEMTKWTYERARELGFSAINIDLIYGLPFQTLDSFEDTVQKIIEMRPDRISLFSYAKVPWLKPHQKAIKEETLPSIDEKFRIYAMARDSFMKNGYLAIGMDHFAIAGDEMAECYKNKKMARNFQGYTVKYSDDMLGFGVTSIGYVSGSYVQNCKELENYYAKLDQDTLPVQRGKLLSSEDHLRKWVIHTLMSEFELDKKTFQKKFQRSFDAHFSDALQKLLDFEKDGLVVLSDEKIEVTSIGELFIRLIASVFDEYLNAAQNKSKFSNSI